MIRLQSLAGASPAYSFSCSVQECTPDQKVNQVVQENLAGGARVYQTGTPKNGRKMTTLPLSVTDRTTLRAMSTAGQFFSFSHDLDTGTEDLAQVRLAITGERVWRRGKYILTFEVWEV